MCKIIQFELILYSFLCLFFSISAYLYSFKQKYMIMTIRIFLDKYLQNLSSHVLPNRMNKRYKTTIPLVWSHSDFIWT